METPAMLAERNKVLKKEKKKVGSITLAFVKHFSYLR
jgi:hypothetical protein